MRSNANESTVDILPPFPSMLSDKERAKGNLSNETAVVGGTQNV